MTRSGFLPDRTIHLHATRRCNLACAHCYSSSSPFVDEMLDHDVVERALTLLRGEGYTLLSLSGGEPLLYPRLGALCDFAHGLGYRVVAISNGYRVKAQFDDVLARLDGMAISFDGMGEAHNSIRGRADAYQVALDALKHLQASGVPSAAAYTVSRESIADVPDFVELAAQLGVRAVQLRPLVMAGRAREKCEPLALNQADLARLFLIGGSLASAYAGEIAVHTDLAPAALLATQRAAYAGLLDGAPVETPLADMINPLVITPAGALKPFTFDFPEAFDLGRIEALATVGSCTLRRNLAPFRKTVEQSFAALAERGDLIDWFAFCRDVAEESVLDAALAGP